MSFRELIRANDGSLYENSTTILLLDLKGDDRDEREIDNDIREHYTTSWCQHNHDCCGCWRTFVGMVTMDNWRAMVELRHVQNV